jgi:phage recombination protein Bet
MAEACETPSNIQRHEGGWTPERVELVKRSICPRGISNDEFLLFIEQCKRSGLDPLLREAFCVPRRQKVGNDWVSKHEFQPSEAGMLSRAERFPDYEGIAAAEVYEEDEITIDYGSGEVSHRVNPTKRKGRLAGAWAKVQRRGKVPVVVFVRFEALVQQSPLWAKMPDTMIRKCARVAALRTAFPEAFGGLYIREEMPAEEFQEAPEETKGKGRKKADVEVLPPEPKGLPSNTTLPAAYQTDLAKAQERFKTPTESPGEILPEPEPPSLSDNDMPPPQDPAAAPGPKAREETHVQFGPHKEKPIIDLLDGDLESSIKMANDMLADAKNARARWRPKAEKNLAALMAERDFRANVMKQEQSQEAQP